MSKKIVTTRADFELTPPLEWEGSCVFKNYHDYDRCIAPLTASWIKITHHSSGVGPRRCYCHTTATVDIDHAIAVADEHMRFLSNKSISETITEHIVENIEEGVHESLPGVRRKYASRIEFFAFEDAIEHEVLNWLEARPLVVWRQNIDHIMQKLRPSEAKLLRHTIYTVELLDEVYDMYVYQNVTPTYSELITTARLCGASHSTIAEMSQILHAELSDRF